MIELEEGMETLHVPRGILLAAAALILLASSLAFTARRTGTGAVLIAAPAAETTAQSRELRFADRADGAIVVTDAATGATVEVVAPGTNTFIRGALRGLAFDRRRAGIGSEPPFRLTLWRDGRLTLTDPTTAVTLDLDAYGPDNRVAFASLLHKDVTKVSVN